MSMLRWSALALSTVVLGSGGLIAATTGGADAVTPSPTAGDRGTLAEGVSHAENDKVPPGALWSEAYFDSTDGVRLHADVLRPAGLAPNAKTPVIVSMGPYFSHNGQTSPEFDGQVGPSSRFTDFVEGAQLMKRGYTFVMVDLRGFGGSTGCLDWLGPGEQADVAAAVKWAASRPWSTGKVGTYGKSYDAATGIAASTLHLKALRAVVAQEPVWNMYDYLFSNGVARPNSVGTPVAYDQIASMPQQPTDDPTYVANSAYELAHPECNVANITDNALNSDASSAYWKARNLAAHATGSSTPLFFTQGFIEDNTKPEDMETYLRHHTGYEQGWLGQWEHVRGNDVVDGKLAQGRPGWFAEVMRFYNRFLKGTTPRHADPRFALEDSLGHWRAQSSWPIVDARQRVPLTDGSYLDTAALGGSTPITTWSRPLTRSVRITATPRVSFTASDAGSAHVQMWDVAPSGAAVLIDENVASFDAGPVAFDLKSTDWTLPRGHRLAVQIGTIETSDWVASPTFTTIGVSKGRLAIALQSPRRDQRTAGGRSPYLDTYRSGYATTFDDVPAGSFTVSAPR